MWRSVDTMKCRPRGRRWAAGAEDSKPLVVMLVRAERLTRPSRNERNGVERNSRGIGDEPVTARRRFDIAEQATLTYSGGEH